MLICQNSQICIFHCKNILPKKKKKKKQILNFNDTQAEVFRGEVYDDSNLLWNVWQEIRWMDKWMDGWTDMWWDMYGKMLIVESKYIHCIIFSTFWNV